MKYNKILSIIIIITLSTIIAFAYNTSTNLSLRLLEATDDIRPFREDFNYNFEIVDDLFNDVSLTEFGYLDGVTSTIQTQLGLRYLKTEMDSFSELQAIISDKTLVNIEDGITATAIQDDLILKADFADEDWGDMTVSTNVVTIDSGVITYAKIQNISATDKILGRSSAGAGVIEEITCTSAGRALIDDADASAQRTTLGIDLSLYYLKTEIDTQGEIETIWGATLATDTELAALKFTDLDDTPATYDNGKYAKSTVDGVIWDTPSGGYTNLTSFVDQTAWRVFYSNTDGDVVELALGTDGQYLKSTGATSAPIFDTPTGAGDMLKVAYDTDEDSDIDVAAGGTEKSSWTLYAIPYLSGTTTFGEITIGTAGQILKVSAGATGYEFANESGGVTTFVGLTDTPANYTGEAGKYVKVNVGENALEFGTIAGESNTASNVGAEVEIFKQKDGVDLEFRTLKADSDKITISTVGSGENYTIRPSGVGDLTEIDNQFPDETYHWDKVDDTVSDEDTTYIWQDDYNGFKIDLFQCPDPSLSGTINSVTIYIIANTNSNANDANNTIGSSCKTHDTVYNGTEYQFSSTGSWLTFSQEYTANPNTALAWTWDEIDALQIGVRQFNWTGAVPKITQVYAVINYSGVTDYVMFDVVETEMDVVNLLSSTTVAFNANADTTLYTVPTGKRCVLSHAIVVAAGDAGANTTVSIGQNTAETDFVPANTLSNLDAEYDSVILMPIPNTTPLKIKSYAADTVIEAQVASQSGVAGNTIYLFGILY